MREKDKRNAFIQIRMTGPEKNHWIRFARKRKITLSELIRDAMDQFYASCVVGCSKAKRP